MSDRTYESPELTVLGHVADLTEGGSSGGSDNSGLDGNGSFQVPK